MFTRHDVHPPISSYSIYSKLLHMFFCFQFASLALWTAEVSHRKFLTLQQSQLQRLRRQLGTGPNTLSTKAPEVHLWRESQGGQCNKWQGWSRFDSSFKSYTISTSEYIKYIYIYLHKNVRHWDNLGHRKQCSLTVPYNQAKAPSPSLSDTQTSIDRIGVKDSWPTE